MNPCESLGAMLQARHLKLAVAESCTGGLLGAALTGVPGASNWFAGGVIAYANSVKTGLLGVQEATLAQHGAVSKETVLQMASGACKTLGAEVGLSISGIAGPDGGTLEKPVGTVWIGYCVQGRADAERYHFTGDREEVRAQAAATALLGLRKRVEM